MNLEICCLRRSGSNVFQKLLESSDVIVYNGTSQVENTAWWKHGPTDKIKDGILRLVLTKHPYAQIRSQYMFYLLNDFKIPTLFEYGKKVLGSISWSIPTLLYASTLDLYLHAYQGWFEHPNHLHISYEKFLQNPQQQFNKLTRSLGLGEVPIDLPATRVQPRKEGPQITDQPFDPSFYLQNRWVEWYGEAEKEWIEHYVNRYPHHHKFKQWGYETTFKEIR